MNMNMKYSGKKATKKKKKGSFIYAAQEWLVKRYVPSTRIAIAFIYIIINYIYNIIVSHD